jgi:hypothetical protein
MEKQKQKKESVELVNLNKRIMKIKIKSVDGSSYMPERMPMEIAEAIDKKKSNKMVKEDKRAEEEKIEDKIHYTEDGKVGIPAIAFHKGMIEVAPYIDGLDKKLVTGSIRVLGGIIPIKYSKQTVNKTWGRQSGISKAPRLIIRPEFHDWSCVLEVMYNASNISSEQILNLLNWAGFQDGIGGWRPQCKGNYGQYEVTKGGE